MRGETRERENQRGRKRERIREEERGEGKKRRKEGMERNQVHFFQKQKPSHEFVK